MLLCRTSVRGFLLPLLVGLLFFFLFFSFFFFFWFIHGSLFDITYLSMKAGECGVQSPVSHRFAFPLLCTCHLMYVHSMALVL